MKKKNIGFILFGVAGGNLVSLLIVPLVFPPIIERYEELEMSTKFIEILIPITIVINIVSCIILISVGVILLIKFREK
ncbi:MAG: hypothetical protein ACFFA0_16280 [Promethearchaeota archaeon]